MLANKVKLIIELVRWLRINFINFRRKNNGF